VKLPAALNKARKHPVGKNAAATYSIHIANYVLPLVIVPYLVRTLGPREYGVVAFGQGLVSCIAPLTEYGFTYSATRQISVQRDDPMAVSRTVSTVLATKALLSLGGLVLLGALIVSVSHFREMAALLIVLYGVVLGNALFPTWLFLGMERMPIVSVVNLAVRSAVVVGVFITVRTTQDGIIYAGITSIGSLGAGLVGAVLAFALLGVQLTTPSWLDIKNALRDGFPLFISTASITMYTAGNAFVLGLLSTPVAVGYFSAGEKVVKAVTALSGPLAQATYPRISRLASLTTEEALGWARLILWGMSLLGLFASVSILAGASWIANLVLGPDFQSSVHIIRILSPLPLLVFASNALGVQTMLPLGRDRAFTAIVVSAGLVNILLAFVFVPVWREIGMAVAVLSSEAFVTGSMLLYLLATGLKPLGRGAPTRQVQKTREGVQG